MIESPLSAIQRRLDQLLAGRLVGWTDAEEAEYHVLCNAETGLLRVRPETSLSPSSSTG